MSTQSSSRLSRQTARRTARSATTSPCAQCRRPVRHRTRPSGPRGRSRRPASKLIYDRVVSRSSTQDLTRHRRTRSGGSAPNVSSRSAIRPTRSGSPTTSAGRGLFAEGVLRRRRHRVPAVQARNSGPSAEGVMGVGGSNADFAGSRRTSSAIQEVSAASPTAGRARSPTRACRCCSRRSSASAVDKRRGDQGTQTPARSTPSSAR